MDDEKNIILPLSQILQEIGYEVELAAEGSEAIAEYTKAQEEGKPFDVVILDLTIPGGMGGEQTIERLVQINPEIKAIVSSGYSNNAILSNPRKHHFSAVVTKPYKIEELRRVLYQVLKNMN